MKEFQIEEVEHDHFNSYLKSEENVFLLIQRMVSKKLVQVNLFSDLNANKFCFSEAVGCWRVKPTDK